MNPRRSSNCAIPAPRLAIGYVRVSTEEQATCGVSLDAQEAKITAYCSLHDLPLQQIIRDEGVSASKPLHTRPGGSILCTAVNPPVTDLVAMKLDRCFRGALDALQMLQAWERGGITLHFTDLGAINGSSPIARFTFQLLASVAELERNQIGERTRTAMQYAASQGVSYGQPSLDSTPSGRDVIAHIRAMRESGHSLRSMVDRLNAEGIPTLRALHGKTAETRGSRWHLSVLHSVIGQYL